MDFVDFLIGAKQAGYASGSEPTKSEDGSYSTVYEREGWKFNDNWFGGEPFGGREVVFRNGKPYWMMVYYGSDSGKDSGVIPLLRKSLQKPPREMPARGPSIFEDGNLVYENNWEGNIFSFSGQEKIEDKRGLLYSATYAGGLVDQK